MLIDKKRKSNLMRNIVLSINNLQTGGAERFVVQLANSFLSMADSVCLISGEPLDLKMQLNPDCDLVMVNTHPGKKLSLLRYCLTLPFAVIRIMKFLRKFQSNAVFTFLPASAFPTWIAAKFLSIPVYYFPMHGFEISSKFEWLLQKSGIPNRLVSKYIAGSEYLAKELLSDWGVKNRSHILECGMGVDTSKFTQSQSISHDGFIIGCISRLSAEKDVALLIRSFAELKSLVPAINVRVVIGGDGPELQGLMELVKTLNLDKDVDFLGKISDPEAILKTFDIYVQTTKNPNIGLSAMEALSSGVPLLIAYRSQKEYEMASDTLKGYDAGWLASATPADMARTLMSALDREGLAKKKKMARQLAEDKYNFFSNVSLLLSKIF